MKWWKAGYNICDEADGYLKCACVCLLCIPTWLPLVECGFLHLPVFLLTKSLINTYEIWIMLILFTNIAIFMEQIHVFKASIKPN